MSEWQFWLLLSTIFFTNSVNKDIKSSLLAYTFNQVMLGYCLASTVITRFFV